MKLANIPTVEGHDLDGTSETSGDADNTTTGDTDSFEL